MVQVELRLGHMAMSLYAYEAAIHGSLVGVRVSEFIHGAPMLDGAVIWPLLVADNPSHKGTAN
jgi:hypothetical protein